MLDWLNFFKDSINLWWPWINLLNELFVIQFFILYTMYLIYSTNNLYFSLFYLFIIFFYFGIFLSIYNLELFTAFLWLTECVIIFVSILFLFYLNVYGNVNKTNLIIFSFKYYGLFLSFIIFTLVYIFPSEIEFFMPTELNNFVIWDDYYEALWNNKMNDLFGLYLSYYTINSFEFLIVGLLLLMASLVCVNLNKFNRNMKSTNYYELTSLFDFFDDFVKFIFMRKQNLVDQNISSSSTRVFKKKVSK